MSALKQRSGEPTGHSNSADQPETLGRRLSEVFAENIFSLNAVKGRLSDSAYERMKAVILKQEPIDFETAEHMAQAMIEWAMAKGVTHYTHWFHPLTNASAEKHDAFFKPSHTIEDRGIESLSAAELVQREPDGSSFPSGGLRATHEARSYTIWDPSSPMFILETENGKTLYVPAVFISYTGESLDYKTPLLKANHALNVAATRACRYFDPTVTHVFSTLGWEQEYFLVDEQFVNARPDLLLAGRTVFGGRSAKGQQMDDHYFGSIPVRVQNFMKDFELEALKLGIPIVTRHNEVAPGQYECAPTFEETNMAVDHNLLVMDVMQKIAIKHRFRILFEEKPFAGLNGSGKHSNWSLANSHERVLLKPGDDPGSNLEFLTFFINVIKAVHDNGDILRASIASAGNDYRLGANEAPPAIMSVYTGDLLEQVLSRFKAEGLASTRAANTEVIDLNLTKIPAIEKDRTDRNRTSPFAFTGNRFEFRAVGASANCAAPMTALNTIVANQLAAFCDEVDRRTQTNPNTDENIVAVLQGYMADVERVVFNGNGYSHEWQEDAASRGLANNRTTPDALKVMMSDKATQVFGAQGVFNERELHSRYDVLLENYINKIAIEADLLEEMSRTHVLPAASETINKLGQAHRSLTDMGLEQEARGIASQAAPIAEQTVALTNGLSELKAAKAAADAMSDTAEVAQAYCNRVKPFFDVVRSSIDALEGLVDDKAWPVPKYRELLFVR